MSFCHQANPAALNDITFRIHHIRLQGACGLDAPRERCDVIPLNVCYSLEETSSNTYSPATIHLSQVSIETKFEIWSDSCVEIWRSTNTLLQWRHNGQRRLKSHALGGLFKLTSKKISKPALLALCEGNPPVTGEFPSQRARNAENVSIEWCHHDNMTVFILPYINYHHLSLHVSCKTSGRIKPFHHQFRNVNESLKSCCTKSVWYVVHLTLLTCCFGDLPFSLSGGVLVILSMPKLVYVFLTICLTISCVPWWRHQMGTFSALLAICREITGHRWIPLTKASEAAFWCFLWSAA